ncbi:MAG: TonB-dependent receptor [Bacteroidia bacterium]|nr:TonB-dependent receptor [Bacteroidia bacterium]
MRTLVLMMLLPALSFAQQNKVLSGFIKDAGSKEMLIGASIAIPKLKTGTISNAYGFYSITLPADSYEVIISYVGYAPKAFRINLTQNVELDVEIKENSMMKEAVITDSRQTSNLAEQTRMSVIEIPVNQIKDIPALLGEKDVLKVIQLLPGVQKPSEGNSGIYVRGGGPDQNLIILDEAIVYNAFHLFGFFSLFNGDALKSIELTKGGFPARYGGRLSSVIDMSMKEGNKQKIKGEAGIGIVSARFLLEGPIIKNKSSFIISARRTYIDALIRPFMTDDVGGYYFYDVNAKANYEFNNKNRLYVSGYFGQDRFFSEVDGNNFKSKYSMGWGNSTASVRLNHLYNNKMFSNTSFIFSNYRFQVKITESDVDGSYSLNYRSGIRDYSLKHDVDYRPNKNHSIRFGGQSIYHQFTPSAIVVNSSFIGEDTLAKNIIGSIENALYIEDDIKIGLRVRINPGLRLTHFTAGKRNYFNAEPRLNAAYNIKSDLAVKASYAIMNQYVHLLTNTGIGLPTDLWVPSSDNLKPQRSSQIAAGIAKDFNKQNFSVSIEGYYKKMNNIIAYKEGASFIDIENTNNTDKFSYEKNITSGTGESYGAEFLIQRKTGKLTGWIGYTLSWIQWQFDELNFGKPFWARYDRRHDISIVGIYKIKEQKEDKNGLTFSATWVYGTGNAITLPMSTYPSPRHNPGTPISNPNNGWNETVSEYTSRNAFRMAPYHRLDVGLQIHKQMKNWIRTWEISVYNVYNRLNPFFYYAESNGNTTRLRQITLFPFIPSISWNIKF